MINCDLCSDGADLENAKVVAWACVAWNSGGMALLEMALLEMALLGQITKRLGFD